MVRTAHRNLRIAGAIAGTLFVTATASAQVGTGFKADAISALNAAASQPVPAPVQLAPATAQRPAALPAQPASAVQAPPLQPAVAQPVATQPPAEAAADPGLADLGFKPERDEQLEVGANASSEISTIKMAFLLIFLGIAALVAWYLQKRAGQKKGIKGLDTSLEVLSSIRVGGRWQIALVRVPGSVLVVGVSDKGINLLTELPPDMPTGSLPVFEVDRPPQRTAAASPSSPLAGPPPRATRPSTGVPSQALGTPPPGRESGEFLDHLLRLTDATPATTGEAEMVEGEQADIRRRLQRYQKSGGME